VWELGFFRADMGAPLPPQRVHGLGEARAVAVSPTHRLAVLRDGTVLAVNGTRSPAPNRSDWQGAPRLVRDTVPPPGVRGLRAARTPGRQRSWPGLGAGGARLPPGFSVRGGGAAEAGGALLDPLRARMRERAGVTAVPPVRISPLGGRAGLLGAARLALERRA
jgi:predicted NBD/HSP70 family sugar kinase